MIRAQRMRLRLLALVLLLAACPHRIDYGPSGEPKSAADLLERVRTVEASVIGVKGDSKLKVESPQVNGTVTLFVAVTHPSYVHLEQLDFFGRPQGVLVSDGKTFSLYDGQQNQFFRGPATAQNVGRFIPLSMAPSELASLLMGRAPRLADAEAEMKPDEKGFVVTLKKGLVTQTLWVSVPRYRVIKSEIRGVRAYDVTFEDFDEAGATNYPRRAILTADEGKIRIELNYKDVVVNEQPDLSLYVLEPPANVPIVDVDEQGHPVGSKK